MPNFPLPPNPNCLGFDLNGNPIRGREYIGKGAGVTSEGQYSWQENHEQIVWDINFSQTRAAIGNLLGWPRVAISPNDPQSQSAPNYWIYRTGPMQHPLYSNMYGIKCGATRGWKWVSKDTTGVSDYFATRTPTVYSTLPFRTLNDSLLDTLYPPVRVAPYNQFPNRYTRQEWQRYVRKTTIEPNTTQLQRDRAQFVWGDSSQTDTAPIFGNNIPAPIKGQLLTANIPIAVRLSQPLVKWTWFQVPFSFLFQITHVTLFGIPFVNDGAIAIDAQINPSLISAVGTVNSTTFPPAPDVGYPPGTLLLDSIRLTERMAPAPATYLIDQLRVSNLDPPLCFDVDFNFLYFNPPTDGQGGPGPIHYYGWNLLPYSNGYWYLVKNQQGPGGAAINVSIAPSPYLFQQTEYALLFQSANSSAPIRV